MLDRGEGNGHYIVAMEDAKMGYHIGMITPSDDDPEREMMGISLCMNSALRGIRRARSL